MKKLTLSALLAASACAPFAVHAADGTINITGSVISASCVPSAGGNPTTTVNLDPAPANELVVSGATAAKRKTFNISVSNCLSGTAKAYFESTNANVDATTGNLKNTATAGAATNVQVAIYRGDTKLDLSKTNAVQDTTAGVALTSDGAATPKYSGDLTYSAGYAATGMATGGTVSTSITYVIDNS